MAVGSHSRPATDRFNAAAMYAYDRMVINAEQEGQDPPRLIKLRGGSAR